MNTNYLKDDMHT